MGGRLIEIDEARAMVLAEATALGAEQVALADAPGRTLAGEVRSERALPQFDNSAMDGFALRCSDVSDVSGASGEPPVLLRVSGEARAGRPYQGELHAGCAVAISTGAVLPQGADAVVPLEDVAHLDGRVAVSAPVAPGANVRRAGEDVQAGALVLSRGERIGPAELGMLAALGHAHVSCARRPRVALLTTGDELVAPGEPLHAGEVYDSNSLAVAALAEAAGAQLRERSRVRDERDATAAAIERALAGCDVLVLCGGVSVGAHDHVKDALAQLGVERRFWGIALKPGKPTWFGVRGETLVFGLPGNPVSAMVTFALLVAPALRSLAGEARVRRAGSALLAREVRKPAGRAHALRCRLRLGECGLWAQPMPSQGSHVLSSMVGADALALIPSAAELVAEGEAVELELLDPAPLGGLFESAGAAAKEGRTS